MKKTLLLLVLFFPVILSINAQVPADTTNSFQYPSKEALPKPYNPKEDASKKLNEILTLAKKENKNVFIQAGGNWCIWCLRFNYFVHNTPELKNILDKNFIYYHLNYSPENKNEKVFKKYTDITKKYGYPFFIILSKDGKVLHIQESGIFESGKGYDVKKVELFLNTWTPKPKISISN
ncbi:MAG: thioredoxin family protein [Paludibacteraceae bacterium]